ncbi:hypothetical protein EYZ11_005324 [Aspergillus tanneri]|uniref:Uncharacterized protein n=1 Tax=Aspergillus tanneri TaxID=1220188 RepID=A0A4S3JKP5_9EURO|nr:uncharacterized protein ATNIH1004_003798 [Aspergillus tanneri]KAA8651105.1 hypothetical protein ATNIH1004_003798 [Aspergillus tanneri]THC95208.1 hypothetical protein EYZ11_005324 [Aspergillus tanneri]
MTREEQIARMSQRIDIIQEQNPESDFKTSAKWWVPSIDLSADIKETLDRDSYEKYSACFAKLFAGKFAPDVMAETRSEAQEILAQHPDLFERVDVMIFQNEKILGQIHGFATEEEAAGLGGFGRCNGARVRFT